MMLQPPEDSISDRSVAGAARLDPYTTDDIISRFAHNRNAFVARDDAIRRFAPGSREGAAHADGGASGRGRVACTNSAHFASRNWRRVLRSKRWLWGLARLQASSLCRRRRRPARRQPNRCRRSLIAEPRDGRSQDASALRCRVAICLPKSTMGRRAGASTWPRFAMYDVSDRMCELGHKKCSCGLPRTALWVYTNAAQLSAWVGSAGIRTSTSASLDVETVYTSRRLHASLRQRR